MEQITLINMPFSTLRLPSIALTQLKSVLLQELGDRVSVRILYLNQDCAKFVGTRAYLEVSDSVEANMAGLGDWFFKTCAFPEAPDDAHAYFVRHFPNLSEEFQHIKRLLLRKREQAGEFLDELVTRYQLDQDRLVGFTSMFQQNVASFALAKRIKQRNPACTVVVGGANCETPMGQEIARNVKSVDFVFSGPGLKTFTTFVKNHVDHQEAACHQIRGVFSKKNLLFSQVDKSAIGEELDLNRYVPLDYDSFLDSTLRNFPEIEPMLNFETSRGCWWGQKAHCTFCGLNGQSMNYTAANAELALQVLDDMFKYVPRCRRFMAVDNIMPKNYIADVFAKVTPPDNTVIFYEVKADLTPSDMAIMSKAHVTEIQPGIEALATSTLKLMKKGTTAFQNIKFLKNCVIHGIKPSWNLLIGFPRETEDVYRKYLEDIPLLSHLYPPVGAFPVRFDRYSPYFTKAAEYGLSLKPNPFYKTIYPFSDEALANMAYFFVDQSYASAHLSSTVQWSTVLQQKIDEWRMQWDTEYRDQPPTLEMVNLGTETAIRDFRGSQEVVYKISPISKVLLEELETPSHMERLTSRRWQFSGIDLAAELECLKARGLVFEENERWLSLVMGKPGSEALEEPTPDTREEFAVCGNV